MLLLTLLCAGQIYGMDPTSPVPYEASSEVRVDELRRTGPLYPEHGVLAGSWENLPPEVKSLIITAVAQSGDNLDEAIKNIVRFSRVNKKLNSMINLNDLQGFTKIVHMLAGKFKDITIPDIADSFDTLLAEKYVQLNNELRSALLSENIDDTKKFISEGADVNYSGFFLTKAVFFFTEKSIEMVQLLLDNGANPYAEGLGGLTPLECLNVSYRKKMITTTQYEQIKTLLENAMKKYRQ